MCANATHLNVQGRSQTGRPPFTLARVSDVTAEEVLDDDHDAEEAVAVPGRPGFVRVIDERTLVIPEYDGNGMYRSWGNVTVNQHVGLLFVDFAEPDRMRVNGTATIEANDPLLPEFVGAVFLVRVTAAMVFPNCARYVHRMNLIEHSVFAPAAGHIPPVPGWKNDERFRDALPARDRPSAPDPGKP